HARFVRLAIAGAAIRSRNIGRRMTVGPGMVAAREIQFGVDTFGDVTVDLAGETVPQAQVIRNVIAEGQLADRVGIDAFGLGEQHGREFAVATPETVLAWLATTTERI